MGHGGMSCGMKTVRCIMVLFNIVFFVSNCVRFLEFFSIEKCVYLVNWCCTSRTGYIRDG